MKRREFLRGAGALAGIILPVSARSQTRPCPPSTISVQGGTSAQTGCSPVDAQADWLARSTGSRVVWAHRWETDEEAAVFNATPSTPDAYRVAGGFTRKTSGGPNNGPYIELKAFGGGEWLNISSISDGPVCTVTTATPHNLKVGDYAEMLRVPAPWSNYIETRVTPGTQKPVLSVPSSTTFTVNAGASGFGAWPGDARAIVHKAIETRASLILPFAAFVAGHNGLAVPDKSAGTGRLNQWNANGTPLSPTSPYRFGYMKNGFYGHASYHNTWTAGIDGDNPSLTPADWDGDEWYLQYRVRISASRGYRGQNGGKLAMITYVPRDTEGEIVVQPPMVYPPPTSARMEGASPQWADASKVVFYSYGGKPVSYALVDPPSLGGFANNTTYRLQNVSRPNSCYLTYNAAQNTNATECVWSPYDQWVTYLIHFKAGRCSGRNYMGRTGNSGSPPYPETTYEVWQALPGQGYEKLISVTNYAWSWNQDDLPQPQRTVVPGHNCVKFTTYQNNISPTVEYTQDIAECIFSTSFIPAPSV